MKLAFRLIVFALAGIILIAVVNGIVRVRRQVQIYHQDVQTDTAQLGLTLQAAVSDAWLSGGQMEAMRLIDTINADGDPTQVRWVWFDVPPDDPDAPARPDAPKLLGRRDSVLGLSPKAKPDDPEVYAYFRVDHPGERAGALEIAEDLTPLHDKIRTSIIHDAVATLATVLASALIVALTSIAVVGRPLHKIVAQTRRIGAGDYTQPLKLRQRDELGALGDEINTMTTQIQQSREALRQETEARIETLEQLRHTDRLKTVGRLASGVAHELGTPLNVITGHASLIETSDDANESIRDSTRIIRAQSDRITSIIRQLLDFARRGKPRYDQCDLRAVSTSVMNMLKTLSGKRRISFSLDGEDRALTVLADPAQIEQVLTNLVVNGIDAMPDGGSIRLTTGRRQAAPPPGHSGAEGVYCYVKIEDHGQGIPADILPHVFEPFFTTKDVGKGTGLGLSIAYGIVQEHGGWIQAHSEPGQGSCFTVYLPEEKT